MQLDDENMRGEELRAKYDKFLTSLRLENDQTENDRVDLENELLEKNQEISELTQQVKDLSETKDALTTLKEANSQEIVSLKEKVFVLIKEKEEL